MISLKFKDESWDELCPIFLQDNENFIQIGTGVLINIFEKVYLLTAAHVIDELYKTKTAKLLVPSINGFEYITGTLYHRHLKENESRENDKIDFSFYELSTNMINILHESFIPLNENMIHLKEKFISEIEMPINLPKARDMSKFLKGIQSNNIKIPNDYAVEFKKFLYDRIITFAGYPYTKAKIREDVYSSEIAYYYGNSVSNTIYENFDYDPSTQIIAEHGKKGVMNSSFELITAIKPQGISGGGVYKLIQTDKGIDRLLIGIGHTHKKKHHLFIGTNITFCLDIIYNKTILKSH